MNYNTQGFSLFCIIPCPVLVKCVFWGTWNFNTKLGRNQTLFFLLSLIQQRTLNASLWGLSVTLFDRSLKSAVIIISVFINTHTKPRNPASISYCSAVHDLLLPALLTWLSMQVLYLSFFFFDLYLLYNLSSASDALITFPSVLKEV